MGASSQPEFCSRFHHAVELVGRRWSGAVLNAILEGNHRYRAIRGAIPGLSDTMLAQRLRELEAEGLLERRVLDSSPVRVEYHLTAKGQALDGPLQAIAEWAEKWLAAEPDREAAAGSGT